MGIYPENWTVFFAYKARNQWPSQEPKLEVPTTKYMALYGTVPPF